MTTSFCYFVHGDLSGSLRANPVAPLLAAAGMLLMPWLLFSAIWGRRFGVRNYEVWLTRGVLMLLLLMMINWGIQLGWIWWSRT